MSSTEQRVVKQIAAALAGVDRRSFCSGSFVPKKPVTLDFPKSKERVRFDGKPVLAPLLDRCVRAAFGKGEQTVRDRNVRDALQLKAPAFSVEGFEPADVLTEVTRALCPDAPGSLTAKLYDVSVYERGGRFVGHKDTPAERDMLGTLVVCLPSRFVGGELDLSHGSKTQRLDFGVEVEKQSDPKGVFWAAFFGDVDHAVRPVKAGARVTLTYRLLVKRGATVASDASVLLQRLRHELGAALKEPAFLPLGGRLAFPCFHLYGHKSFPKAAVVNEAALLRLKGRDRCVAAVVRELGLRVTLRPYLVERENADSWQLERFPTARDAKNAPRPHTYEQPGDIEGVTLEDLEESFPSTDDESEALWVLSRPFSGWNVIDGIADEEDEDEYDQEDVGDEDEPEPEPVNAGPLEREPLGPTRPSVQFLFSSMFSSTGYFGNEGGEGNFYVYAALEADVPEAAKRGVRRTADMLKAVMQRRRKE